MTNFNFLVQKSSKVRIKRKENADSSKDGTMSERDCYYHSPCADIRCIMFTLSLQSLL